MNKKEVLELKRRLKKTRQPSVVWSAATWTATMKSLQIRWQISHSGGG